MRKIILGVAVTLDGFIEGPNGEYDWCFTDQDYGMSDFIRRIDAILYGRKSYEMMKGIEMPEESSLWSGRKSYVVSNTIKEHGQDFELISGDIAKEIVAIKNSQGKDIWLFGGASLTTSLLNMKLVDELWLSVHPILLGKGKFLFSGIQERVKTTLIESKVYETGLVSLRYAIG
jgi:dihydrofolate reductase